MRPIGLEDVLGRERYGQARDAIRRRVIAHKRARRVAVGDRLSLVFEDRVTVWYQTQEMLWVEHITDLDAIRDELDIYNALLPGDRDLAATLFIEVPDQARMQEEFARLLGLDRHLVLEIGRATVPARFEEGRQTEARISAVQYVRFPLDDSAWTALGGGAPIAAVVDLPQYRVRTVFPDDVHASLVASVLDPAWAERALRHVRDGDPA
jgi:uncharacterized protein DUF3501